MRPKRRISFDPLEDKVIPKCSLLSERTRDQLKAFWYSREELMDSCVEAKKIIKIILSVDGKMEAIDHSQFCVVGLEKFHGKKEREKYRKLLIKSVLIRQEMSRRLGLGHDANCLAEISSEISATFKEFALWQAAMHRFHAYGAPPLATRPSNDRQSPDHGPAKRQRLIADFCSVPVSTDISAIGKEDPEMVRKEVQELIAGYCSR